MTDSKSSISLYGSKADASGENWLDRIVSEAHREVDRIRAQQNLPPWDWSKPKKTRELSLDAVWNQQQGRKLARDRRKQKAATAS